MSLPWENGTQTRVRVGEGRVMERKGEEARDSREEMTSGVLLCGRQSTDL